MHKIEALVHNAALASTQVGVIISPREAAFIISLFLQGVADGPDDESDGPEINYVTTWLLLVADIVDEVEDVATATG